MKRDMYQEVTDQIITELEQGAAPWVKPWRGGRRNGIGVMPTNAATGRTYSGINVPILWMAAETNGYVLPGWLTFKQAKELGGAVRRGEKGTTAVFTKKLTVEDDKAESEDATKQISMLRTFTVFNVAQIDGLPEHLVEPAEPLSPLEAR